MAILRHSQIAVTMGIYSQVASASTREALKRLGSQLGEGPRDTYCRTFLGYRGATGQKSSDPFRERIGSVRQFCLDRRPRRQNGEDHAGTSS